MNIKQQKNDAVLYFYSFILVLLNFIRCFDNSFWGDEGFSIGLGQMSISEMLQATANDVHPPFYYFIVSFLSSIGNNGFIYHFSAFLPYLLSMIISLTMVKNFFGRIPCIIFVTLSSLSSNALRYNLEARMYSWASLFVLLSFLLVYKILTKNQTSDWYLFTLTSLCAAYTHYYALVTVAFFYFGFMILSFFKHNFFPKIMSCSLLTLLAYLPWIKILLGSFERTSDNWWLTSIPTITECVSFLFDYSWMNWFLTISLVLFFISQTTQKKLLENHLILWIILGIFAIIGTVIVGLILSHTIRPFFIVRYLFPSSSIAWLLTSFILSRMNHKKIICFLFVFLFLFYSIPNYIDVFKQERTLDKDTMEFKENVIIPANSKILTNYSWNLFTSLKFYYYSDSEIKMCSDQNDILLEVDAAKDDVWLFLSPETEQSILNILQQNEYTYELVWKGRIAVDWAYIQCYKIIK